MQLNNVIASGVSPCSQQELPLSYCFCVYLRLDVNAAFGFAGFPSDRRVHLPSATGVVIGSSPMLG